MDGKELLIEPALENIVNIACQLTDNWTTERENPSEQLNHLIIKAMEARELVDNIYDCLECPDKLEPSNDS